MRTYPYAVYDAFSEVSFGGSQGGIVLGAGDIDADMRLQIAREQGLPAICFVSSYSDNTVTARFQSVKREYSMCGHGTICLMTHLLEIGAVSWDGCDRIDVDLVLPAAKTKVEIHRREDGRAIVMLDISPPEFRCDKFDVNQLANLLGICAEDFCQDLPLETASGDFVHLIVPVKDLDCMRAIRPDFPGVTEFCKIHGLETIACFSQQVECSDHNLHVRDFCPAVGVPESAAAGTTNAALSSYLVRHGVVKANTSGIINIKAEQGLELKRPSFVQSIVHIEDGKIARLQVGGVATKTLDGYLHVPI